MQSAIPPTIYFDPRWSGNHGIGRFASELQKRLPGIVPINIMGPKLSLIDPFASSIALARKRDGCYFSPGFNPPLRSPIPIAFTIHDLVHLKIPTESTFIRQLYYATVVRPAARRAWRVLTVSEHSKQDIVDWSGLPESAVHVVGNGVSPVFSPRGERYTATGPYVLHVGRRVGHKNIDRLLTAFSRSRTHTLMRLMFTGMPDHLTIMHAKTVGLEGNIDFSGDVTDEKLAELYRGATALIFPSLYEGFGLPIIEAMACGTPVITSNSTSTAEVSGPGNSLLVDPRSIDALTEAIDQLTENHTLHQTLTARGLERSKDFTWERVTSRVRTALGLGQ